MSLGQALATSTAGLRATQAALALTASNVANADTPGYVRKTLTTVTSSAGANGVSVRVEAINRELDQYLQRQLRTETSGGAYADLRAQFYSRLQSVYGAPGSTSSLESVFNDFTTSLQALAASPEDSAARAGALSAAQVLTQQLNAMSNSIQDLRSDAELGMASATQQANNAMKAIAAINKQLATSTSQDSTAAVLEDQRDAYIDQLSKLMDIKVVETDRNQVTIFTNSGIQLVGTEAAQFEFQPQGTMTAAAQWNADPAKSTVGSLVLMSATGGSYDMIANNAIRSGQFAAYIEMRDQILPEAQAQLDAIASSMAQALSSMEVPGQPASSGLQTGFTVDVGNMLPGNTIHLSWTDNVTGKQHNVSIIRVDDPGALPLTNDVTADPNDEVIGVDFSGGLASVAAQLNTKFGGKINFSVSAPNTLQILDDGATNRGDVNAVSATVTQTSLSGGTSALPFFTDANTAYSGAITSLGSQSVGFAGRIVVNQALIADPSKLVIFQAGGNTGDPSRPNFIYNQLASSALTYDPHAGIGSTGSPFTGSLPSYLRQVISVQGEAADNAANLAAGQDVVVNALQSRVNEGSSVNIDEEMANLLNLQTAYAANARIMSAVKDMLETLMQM